MGQQDMDDKVATSATVANSVRDGFAIRAAWAASVAGWPRGTFAHVVHLSLALAMVGWTAIRLTPVVNDYSFYHRAAVSLLMTGDPYSQASGYFYPPLLAYLVQPLIFLPAAQYWWFGLNVLACAVFTVLAISLSRSQMARRYWSLVVLLLALFPPLWSTLFLGQVSGFIALLLLLAIWLSSRYPAGAGFLLALAVHIKLYPALVSLYYLLYRPRPVGWWTVVMGTLILVATVAQYGLRPYLSYLTLSLPPGTIPYAAELNVSLYGFWARLLTENRYTIPLGDYPTLAKGLTVLSSLGLMVVCRWVHGRPVDTLGFRLQISLWLSTMMLLSPVNGYYNLILLLFPILTIVACLEQQPDLNAWRVLAVGVALIWLPSSWTNWHWGIHLALHTRWGLLLLTPAVYGQVVLLVLLAILLRRRLVAITD
jgi:hypothetical protein